MGTVILSNAVTSLDPIAGPLSLTITNVDSLGYSSGSWTNGGGQGNVFTSVDPLERIGTNYLALFLFDDGLLQTSEPDYPIWLFLVRSQDTNTNNIPDLVEAPSSQPLPRLEILKTTEGIQLTLHGRIGGGYALQSSDAVANAEWKQVQTGTLTAGSEVVQLPATDGRKFFRFREI